MPWKNEKDPYKVWISEIILQQTRVNQGWDYYTRFVNRFPNISSLANADDDEIYKMWEGLGYYNRCKNLIHTARHINQNLNGSFPDSYTEIRNLKGIGDYTASAIASFCFGLPHAVVDGNVLRVLARIFSMKLPVDTVAGKKQFQKLAAELLDKKNPAVFNQAIMDFGSTVCKPVPACGLCDLQRICSAFQHNEIASLPVKSKKTERKTRWFNYFIFECEDEVLVCKRTSKDIWHGLSEFCLIETHKEVRWTKAACLTVMKERFNIVLPKERILHITRSKKQQLTHQTIEGCFITIKLHKAEKFTPAGCGKWLKKDETGSLAFPRLITQYQEQEVQQIAF